jgi:hypothetical protein
MDRSRERRNRKERPRRAMDWLVFIAGGIIATTEMNFLGTFTPTFIMGAILFVAAMVLRAWNLRIERHERESQKGDIATRSEK